VKTWGSEMRIYFTANIGRKCSLKWQCVRWSNLSCNNDKTVI